MYMDLYKNFLTAIARVEAEGHFTREGPIYLCAPCASLLAHFVFLNLNQTVVENSKVF